jgi:ribosomal protein S28E/S33
MIRIALVVALGGSVLVSDDTAISGAVPFIQNHFKLTGDRGDVMHRRVVGPVT